MNRTLDKGHPYAWYWLLCLTALVTLWGVAMVLVPGAVRRAFSLLIFQSTETIDAMPKHAIEYINLTHGVLGAILAGWGLTMLLILLGPFRRGSHEAWMIMTLPLSGWYIADTVFSLWSGAWPNAVLNTIVATGFAVPLATTYGTCREGGKVDR